MYSNTIKSAATAALIAAACTAPAFSAPVQDAESTFIYASYFTCPGGDPRDVDKVVDEEIAPVYDEGVKDGTILNWGWSMHHTGGKWQRIFTHMSNSFDELLKSSDIMNERSMKANLDPDNKFGKICNTHDDYIWEVKARNITEIEGKASLSVYFQCDIAKEDRTDEIMKNTFAPIYDANMGEGKLTNWMWVSHVYGGKYRRGLFLSAANYSDLNKSYGDVLNTIYADGGTPEGTEFMNICNSHSDYLWNRR